MVRACQSQGWPLPRIVGVELDPGRAATARARFQHLPQVEIRQADFLLPSQERFDFIIGNPPYVSILELSAAEGLQYRHAYQTASGRFDLYSLLFEQALRMLAPDGRLVFLAPEKFLYVETARPLRELLARHRLSELHFASEATFADRVTYPLITMPSAVVATGADGVVMPTDAVPPELRRYAHPTLSGRQTTPTGQMVLRSSLLAPYDANGRAHTEPWRHGAGRPPALHGPMDWGVLKGGAE